MTNLSEMNTKNNIELAFKIQNRKTETNSNVMFIITYFVPNSYSWHWKRWHKWKTQVIGHMSFYHMFIFTSKLPPRSVFFFYFSVLIPDQLMWKNSIFHYKLSLCMRGFQIFWITMATFQSKVTRNFIASNQSASEVFLSNF